MRKLFLLKVGWRLSLVAALLTCASLAAWGQETENPDEGTTEKVMHKIYTYVSPTQNVEFVNLPEEVEDGGSFTFSVRGSSTVGIYEGRYSKDDEDREYGESTSESCTMTIHNVKGAILLEIDVNSITAVVDSVEYNLNPNTLTGSYGSDPSSVAPDNVELKTVINVDGVNYDIQTYWGNYNNCTNVTSITLPMVYWAANYFRITENSMNNMPGLKEVHARAFDPGNYEGIETAFGDKDLSGVTLFVPEGYADKYVGELWERFDTIKTEPIVEESKIYVTGYGIKDYSPKTTSNVNPISITYELEEGYVSQDPNPYEITEGANGDFSISIITHQECVQDGLTYNMRVGTSEAYLVAAALPEGNDEITIPACVVNEKDRNGYRVFVLQENAFANLKNLRKLTIEGAPTIIPGTFSGCTALEEIHCKNMVYPSRMDVQPDAFPEEILETCVVYVPKGYLKEYQESAWGKIFTNIVEEGDTLDHAITYNLENLSMNDTITTVVHGDPLIFNLTPTDSTYVLPDTISVSGAESYTYDPSTGAVEISSVMSDLTIAASAVAPVDTIWCGVSYELENLLLSDSIMRVAMGDTLAFSLIPVDSTYVLPDTISVSGAESYTYDPSTGVVAVPSVMTDVAIKASALKLQNDTIQTDSIVSGQWQEIVIGEKLETASGDTITEVSLNNVTSKVLTVSSEASTILNLSGTNDLGTVTNDGTLVIQADDGATLAGTTIINEGTLTDESGLVTSVEGSAALAVEPLEDVEVKEGSSVELTASASADVRPEFQWQKLENEVWVNVEDEGVVASSAKIMTRASTTYTDKLSVLSENAGSYRCLITRSVSTEEGDGEEGTETVTASTTLAVYAEVTVGSASDGDDDDPVQGGDTGDDDDPVIPDPDPEPTPEPTPDPDPIQYGVSALPCSGAEIKLSAQFVEEGGTLTFTIEIEEGYVADEMIVKVSQGIGKAVEVKPDAKGVYTIKNVDGLVTITVEGVKEATATDIENVEGVQVYSHEGAIYVYTPTEARVMIVAMNGVLKANEEQIGKRRYELPRGFYVVWVEGESFKVAN